MSISLKTSLFFSPQYVLVYNLASLRELVWQIHNVYDVKSAIMFDFSASDNVFCYCPDRFHIPFTVSKHPSSNTDENNE